VFPRAILMLSDEARRRADRTREVGGASEMADERGVVYRIRVVETLSSRWAVSFGGLTLTPANDGSTVIHGSVADQSALFGLLNRVRDLGLTLVSVEREERANPPTPFPTGKGGGG
jgi:hypothetical protein